jgi:hypothetical protein
VDQFLPEYKPVDERLRNIISALFNFSGSVDHVTLARESSRGRVGVFEDMKRGFDEVRCSQLGGGPKLPLASYWGIYEHDVATSLLRLDCMQEMKGLWNLDSRGGKPELRASSSLRG